MINKVTEGCNCEIFTSISMCSYNYFCVKMNWILQMLRTLQESGSKSLNSWTSWERSQTTSAWISITVSSPRMMLASWVSLSNFIHSCPGCKCFWHLDALIHRIKEQYHIYSLCPCNPVQGLHPFKSSLLQHLCLEHSLHIVLLACVKMILTSMMIVKTPLSLLLNPVDDNILLQWTLMFPNGRDCNQL